MGIGVGLGRLSGLRSEVEMVDVVLLLSPGVRPSSRPRTFSSPPSTTDMAWLLVECGNYVRVLLEGGGGMDWCRALWWHVEE